MLNTLSGVYTINILLSRCEKVTHAVFVSREFFFHTQQRVERCMIESSGCREEIK